MTKKVYVLVLVLSLPLLTYAQRGETMERIEAKKIAFITEKLDLSVAEAQQFWPLYNEHKAKMDQLRDENKPDRDMDINALTDAEAELVIDKMLNFQTEELILRKSFIEDMKGVLPVKKVATLITIESQFKKRLIKAVGRRGMEREKRKMKMEKRKEKY